MGFDFRDQDGSTYNGANEEAAGVGQANESNGVNYLTDEGYPDGYSGDDLAQSVYQIPQEVVDSIYRQIKMAELTGPEFHVKGTGRTITINPEKWLYCIQLAPKEGGGSLIVFDLLVNTQAGPAPLTIAVEETIGTQVPERKIISLDEYKQGKNPDNAG